MRLELSGTELAQPVTDDLIIKSIESLRSDDDSFLILSREGVGYIQTVKAKDGTYAVEYRDGAGDDGHFECAEELVDLQKVSAAFISYLHETDEWKTSLKWEPLGSSNKSGSGSVGLLVFSVVAVLAVCVVLIYAYI